MAKHEIARRQAWQNYIEANFGIQRRLADWGFARAGSWPELLAVHDHWVTEHNYQDHWAHQERPEDRRSPAAVLAPGVRQARSTPRSCTASSTRTRFGRVLDRAGYARFRRWRVYAERGLGGEPVAVWLYAEHLTLVYRDEPLAQYRVAYQPDQRRLKTVTPEQLFETAAPLAATAAVDRGARTTGCRCCGCRPTRRGGRGRPGRSSRPSSPGGGRCMSGWLAGRSGTAGQHCRCRAGREGGGRWIGIPCRRRSCCGAWSTATR